MTMVFERVFTPGIAQISYLVGDDSRGQAAVIDPRPDCDIYLKLGRKRRVAITRVFETHIHADFMSGARELVARLGNAELCANGEGGVQYDFDVKKLRDGDEFEFGSVRLKTRFTPGHTPEHIAFEISEANKEEKPWGVFTGDSLFVASAGRPDLLGSEETDELTKQLFSTLRNYYLELEDGVIIYPCHGAGSACGAAIGQRPMSTIGYERQHNDFLQYENFDEFARFVRDGAPPEPHHYKHLKKVNAAGPPVLGNLPVAPGLSPQGLQSAIERAKAQLIDTRQMLGFGGGHIEGAINIGARDELSVWAGQMVDFDRPILLVLEHDELLERVLRLFWRVGFTNFAGYLVGGMKTWENAGLPMTTTPQITVHELKNHLREYQLLDVRAPDEWKKGHIPGATHLFAADLRDGLDGAGQLRRDKPVVTYCDSGYRASVAGSVLQSYGFTDVRNVPGSWQAWTESGYPVEK